MTLMKILTGIHGDLCINVNANLPESRALNVKKRIEMLNMMHKELKKALENIMTTQKKQYNKKHQLMSFQIKN